MPNNISRHFGNRLPTTSVGIGCIAPGERSMNSDNHPLGDAFFQEGNAGNAVLDSIKTFIRRFVSMTESQACVVTVWVVHTHVIEAAYATPYLAITSAEKQSGKSTLLD